MSTVSSEAAPTRRGVRTWSAALLAVAVALVVGLAGCASKDPSKAQMTDAFVTAGIPRSQARCVTNAIYDSLSKSQVRQLIDRGAGGVPVDDPAKKDDANDRLTKAMAACQAIESTSGVGNPVITGDTSTTVPPESGQTTTSGESFTTTTTSPSETTVVSTGSSTTTSPVATTAVPGH